MEIELANHQNAADAPDVTGWRAADLQSLIWLSFVNWAEFSHLIVHESPSQPALSGLWILQVHLVGGTAF
jgi:hypothetical protein